MQIDTSITRKLALWATILESDSASQSISSGFAHRPIVMQYNMLWAIDKSTGKPAQALDQ